MTCAEIKRLKQALSDAGLPLHIRKATGSMRGCLLISSDSICWSAEVAAKMDSLGFRDFRGKPLTELSSSRSLGWLHDYFRHSEAV
jgi:hypothetical protein